LFDGTGEYEASDIESICMTLLRVQHENVRSVLEER